MTNPADLKNIGLKATLPRLKILEIFQHSPVRHLTAEDGIEACSTKSSISVLRRFIACSRSSSKPACCREAISNRARPSSSSTRDRTTITSCASTAAASKSFFDAEIERRQQSIAKERGFKLHEHALALYGACTKENCPHRKH